mmetsp:Transcript_72450/g.183384  ORF Transcript_72450/g.183384 Transcript_72450/m.183384 type:complete len:293 (+) Transcript_72450:561-1439(+)
MKVLVVLVHQIVSQSTLPGSKLPVRRLLPSSGWGLQRGIKTLTPRRATPLNGRRKAPTRLRDGRRGAAAADNAAAREARSVDLRRHSVQHVAVQSSASVERARLAAERRLLPTPRRHRLSLTGLRQGRHMTASPNSRRNRRSRLFPSASRVLPSRLRLQRRKIVVEDVIILRIRGHVKRGIVILLDDSHGRAARCPLAQRRAGPDWRKCALRGRRTATTGGKLAAFGTPRVPDLRPCGSPLPSIGALEHRFIRLDLVPCARIVLQPVAVAQGVDAVIRGADSRRNTGDHDCP